MSECEGQDHKVICKRVDNLQFVMPGWGCCKCRTYNSYDRPVCKACGHKPCYPPPSEETK